MDESQMVQQYVAHGWDPSSALADIRAGGWRNKEWLTGGGSSGGTSTLPPFNEKAAEQKALAELAPYYEQLLNFYGGDVALAKQRIDQDYERGLRIKTVQTDWEKEDYDLQTQERKRKFQIALKDMGQEMNQRGIYESGITKQETGELTAGENYAQVQTERAKQALDRGLQEYKEKANVDYSRDMEKLGYIKPTAQTVSGQYAPSTVGQVAPSMTVGGKTVTANVGSFVSEPNQKAVDLEQQRRKDLASMIADERAAYATKMAEEQIRLQNAAPRS